MILAGDIGGTKTNIALFREGTDQLSTPVNLQSFPSKEFESLDAIVHQYIAAHPAEVTTACFGIAGPVIGTSVQTANLAWHVEGRTLAGLIGIEHVNLINDLEATAYGIESLRGPQLYTLNEGRAIDKAPRALLAAGTGLGMAGLYWDGQHYHPIASEGGHADLSANNELEIDLLRYLREKFGPHVSCERALSGPGLFNIYSFLRDMKYAPEPGWLADEIDRGDKTAAVSNAALAKTSELATKALDVFVKIYGASAGNLGLLLKAIGGVYLGGGVAPRIIEKLKDGTFMRAFIDKGRMSSLVAAMPVHVILDDKTALYGAARCAISDRK